MLTDQQPDQLHEPFYHPAWLANRSGSPLRQRWIRRQDELGLPGSPVST